MHEASTILRRFIRVAAQLDPTELRYLTLSARTLHPFDLRQLATEIEALPRDRKPVIQHGPAMRQDKPAAPSKELRGLARSIIRYGGPGAVRRDADPILVEVVNRIGWTPLVTCIAAVNATRRSLRNWK